MSQAMDLRAIMFERLEAMFGEPSRSEGVNQHWSLRMARDAASIHLLLTQNNRVTVLWMFDPHDTATCARDVEISAESQIEPLVREIEERLTAVARPSPPPGSSAQRRDWSELDGEGGPTEWCSAARVMTGA